MLDRRSGVPPACIIASMDYPALTKNLNLMPLSELENKLEFFKKDQAYLIFCAVGGRSHYLAQILNDRGIKALSVNNGIAAVNAYLKEHGLA